ncbi:TonB-dependent receptor protein [gamma proteobacterium HdN1]|nr:TonB-dependent receptor protein [gamma proteobacterium HdN1]
MNRMAERQGKKGARRVRSSVQSARHQRVSRSDLGAAAGAVGLFALVSGPLFAEELLELDALKISGTAASSVHVESDQEAAERLAAVPGGTNLISLKEAGKLSTLSDALNYQPGVIVQEFFGGLDQPRLNIRGSAIQGNPVSRGVLLRQDHLPLNDADGSFIIGLLNLRDTRRVEVHRGANSRVPGSFTLGGDLDFISWLGEGEDSEGRVRATMETGSFSHQLVHAAYASGDAPHRWFSSVSSSSSDGYRHHSASEQTRYQLNLASRFSDAVSNYGHFSYTDMQFDMPFVLPEATAKSSPESVFGDNVPITGILPEDITLPGFIDPNKIANTVMNMYSRDPHRATRHLRVANNLIWQTKAIRQRLGAYWQRTDDAFVDPFEHIETESKTLGVQWTLDGDLHPRFHYQIGFDYNQSDMPRTYYGNHPLQGKKVMPAFAVLDMEAENYALSASFDWQLNNALTLTSQWQEGRSTRNVLEKNSSERYNGEWDVSLAKIGAIYQPEAGAPRWYANLSQSLELPTFWELVGVDANPILTWQSRAHLQPLAPQKAVTAELGVDQKLSDRSVWELTFFRSEIERELISTASQFGVIAKTDNYDGDTIHQGIEAGFSGHFGLGAHDREWLYRTSWTYSDFYFVNGVFEGNTIAGVPKNLVAAELLFRQGGVKLGPNVRWVPDDNPVDHENTLGQGRYFVLGFAIDALYRDFLRGYINFDNVLDKTYNASYVVRARSNEYLPTFLPGNGFGVTAGVQLTL